MNFSAFSDTVATALGNKANIYLISYRQLRS